MTYVDTLRRVNVLHGALWRITRWGVGCHFTADSWEELDLVAKKLGLQRHWIQRRADRPHYDLSGKKRALAVKIGAKEISRKELVVIAAKLAGKEWPK